ncbi:MAG: FdhF/YdeP family oxidoreductase [Solirubrobacterales bacterium]|nr:FdhF/YdeP family oxidoreductase [Solirubrobacterales bacterium]
MLPAFRNFGPRKLVRASFTMNHKRGFDCPSCAWISEDKPPAIDFCENGMKSLNSEITPVLIPDRFWSENSLSEMLDKSEFWLGRQGRITKPVYRAAGSDHYEVISWDRALGLVADRLRSLGSPDDAVFYTSGRIMNEPAFLYQLLAREYGTNNLPDCSNMCHEATGRGMGWSIGVGKSTVSYSDFEQADLILVMGQNPGTNHPRMLNALEGAKQHGASVVGINPLPEAALLRYRNPQRPKGLVGRGTVISDQFVHIRVGGDQHLIRAIAKRVLLAEEAAPGEVIDRAFIDKYCEGFDQYREAALALDDEEVLAATGLDAGEIEELAERYIRSQATIITWALGLTQQQTAVSTITEIMNLLMLKGNIGRPGAGASPIRGHSNVQGDRTMGIWEQMGDWFLDGLKEEFGFEPPRQHGLDTVKAIDAMERGEVGFFMSMAGNFVAAVSDSTRAEQGMARTGMTVHVSTKLNRSHVTCGRESLILPVLGRSERDVQASGDQVVTAEDSVCRITASKGNMEPVAADLLSDVSVVARLARLVMPGSEIDWEGFEADYDLIRDSISRVIPGFDGFNRKLDEEGTFVLPHGPRDSRTFPTPSGRARFASAEVPVLKVPPGRLILNTVRAHDQHNTAILGLSDRYRGIRKGRFVVFVSPEDLDDLALRDGQTVDIFSERPGEEDRVLRGYRAVAYPTKRGCAAMYFPEANELVHRSAVAEICNTPAYKDVTIRIEPGLNRVSGGRPSST